MSSTDLRQLPTAALAKEIGSLSKRLLSLVREVLRRLSERGRPAYTPERFSKLVEIKRDYLLRDGPDDDVKLWVAGLCAFHRFTSNKDKTQLRSICDGDSRAITRRAVEMLEDMSEEEKAVRRKDLKDRWNQAE